MQKKVNKAPLTDDGKGLALRRIKKEASELVVEGFYTVYGNLSTDSHYIPSLQEGFKDVLLQTSSLFPSFDFEEMARASFKIPERIPLNPSNVKNDVVYLRKQIYRFLSNFVEKKKIDLVVEDESLYLPRGGGYCNYESIQSINLKKTLSDNLSLEESSQLLELMRALYNNVLNSYYQDSIQALRKNT